MSFISAPDGSINNLTVIMDSTTSVTVRWLPVDPNLWNGIIISYTVDYQRQGQVEFVDSREEEYVTLSASIPSLPDHPLANNPDPRLVSLPLSTESLQLEGLEENYVYQFTVYFENSAGQSQISNLLRFEMPPSGNLLSNAL